MITKLLILDPDIFEPLIRDRKRKGIDSYDEVWEGMYVVPVKPSLEHQQLVLDLGTIFNEVVMRPRLGKAYPGVNVSDRGSDWEKNFRVPDLAIVLKNSRAISHKSHIQGGPDLLVEIESPRDDTEEKVLFYSKIGVRELLIIHRDKRSLRLLRPEGEELILVEPSLLDGNEWLLSEVLPLAFRRTVVKRVPRTQIRRTDGQPGLWTV